MHCSRHIMFSTLCAALWCSPVQAQAPADLGDLVGARGSSGETQLEARGYKLVRSSRVRDQSWTFWWSDVQRQCVSIATDNGRYAAINNIPVQNCRPGGSAGEGAPAPAPEVITAVCYGQGQHATYTPHFGYEWNNERRRYEPMQRMESGNEQFNSGVQIDIRGGEGRIHLTGKLIPPLHSGGSADGWWPLEDLRVTQDRITARYRLSGLNRPTVNIDRRSGLIEVKGLTGFNGKCDAGDWGAGRKF